MKEGGGPWLRPHRVFLGWGLLGLVAALLFQHTFFHDSPPLLRGVALMAAGYIVMALIGLAAESIYAWMQRHKNEQRGVNPRTDRISCNLVETKVDSYAFNDKIGKDFDPGAGFQDQAPTWPASIVPSSFVFVAGEAFRDVELQVDAPDEPGPQANFNISVWQGGVPSGGVTVTITRGGP